ncbi:MAG: glycosyltransferase family 4 protein, partial [Leptolinea sp.]|nr:glycosyltransferase family 4 protein [Leptolinea sp.]
EIVNEQNKDVKLKFFGTKEIEKLKSYVSSKGLNHVIEVNGWADDEEKIKALYESTCLILPSYTEGLPNVVLEAMATRTPVIATHVGGLKEILVPWVNAIIVEPGNPRDISEKITHLLDNKEKRDAIAEKAFEEVKNKYDVPIIRKRFAEILNEICN